MMIRTKYFSLLFILLAIACGTPKVVVSPKEHAQTAALNGNFTKAVELWRQQFNMQSVDETAAIDFANAAKSAFKAGDSEQAIAWFDQARYKEFADFEMYSNLAAIYHSKDNISKELSALEFILDNYSEKKSEISDRLFDVYAEIKLNEKALAVWNELDEKAKNEEAKLNNYFEINKQLKDTLVCNATADKLLEINPEHQSAIFWNARKFYWIGENRYQDEMAKYNRNKTTRQYKILLNELDIATADFKRSLKYFEKLWNENTREKYASYFANIYARFGDEKKAAYYKKFMK